MAGSIAYVSFPRFTKNRQSTMATMCRRFIEALLIISGTSSCFPRPARSLANGSSQDTAQTKTANGQLPITSQTAIDQTTNQQLAVKPSQTSSPSAEDSTPTPHTLRRQTSCSTSSSRSTSVSSLRPFPSTLRASLNRRISSWQTNHSDPWPIEHTEGQGSISENTATTTSESDNEDFIASLDALALSQHEREVLSRMQTVCRSARAARKRRLERHAWSDIDATGGVESGLCLRGGGGDDDDVRPFKTPRRRTTLPVDDPVLPKPDSARPPRALWWLAGGRKGQVPTVGDLRVRKEVEQANRKIVGFWGTVLGVRRVGRVGILDDGGGDVDGDVEVDVGEDGGGLDNADSSSSHRSKSIGSVTGAPGADGGGSLASTHREREIEVDQPVEAKAESVMSVASADDGATHAKPDAVDGTARDHESTKSGSITDTGVGKPKAESAKSVAEDHESTQTGDKKVAGAEELRARSESAKSIAEETGVAEAESVRSREGVAETEAKGEEEMKSPSDG